MVCGEGSHGMFRPNIDPIKQDEIGETEEISFSARLLKVCNQPALLVQLALSALPALPALPALTALPALISRWHLAPVSILLYGHMKTG